MVTSLRQDGATVACADLAHHNLHPRIVGRNMQDMTTAEAGAEDTEPVGIDLRLHREPGQSTSVILQLVSWEDPLAWFPATCAEEAIVKQKCRNSGFSESPGERFEVHFLHGSQAMRHGYCRDPSPGLNLIW